MKKLFIGDSSVSSRGSVLPMWRPLFLLGLFSLLMFSTHNAQGQNMVFNATGNTSTSVNSFIDAGGSNYLMAGTTVNSSGISVPIAVKLDQNYQTLWSLQLPSADNCVVTDALYDVGSQTYWIVGTRKGLYNTIITPYSAPRGFVWRISSNGQSSMVREYELSEIFINIGGNQSSYLKPAALRYITPFSVNGQKRYLLTGFTDRNPLTDGIPVSCNALAIAIDENGDIVWQRSYDSTNDPNTPQANWASGAIFTAQNRLFISGLTRIDDNSGSSKADIIEVDPANGLVLNIAHFDDSNPIQPSSLVETAYDIVETTNGELRMIGILKPITQPIPPNPPIQNIVVYPINPNTLTISSNQIWQYDGKPIDAGYSVNILGNTMYINGSFFNTATDSDLFTLAINATTGAVINTSAYGGNNNETAGLNSNSIINNTSYIAGNTNTTNFLSALPSPIPTSAAYIVRDALTGGVANNCNLKSGGFTKSNYLVARSTEMIEARISVAVTNGVTPNNLLMSKASTCCNNFQPQVSSTDADNTLCQGQSATLTASGGVSYAWSTGSTSASILITPTVSTTYFVTVTNSANCSVVVPWNITVDANCCNNVPVSNAYTVNSNMTSSVLFGGSTNITNATVVVAPNTVLTIDNNMNFTGTSFIMRAGASIVVGVSKSLGFDNSTLQGCGQRWRGIVMQKSSTLSMINQTTIKDAHTAVWPSRDCNVRLINAVFDRNFIGVYMAQATTVQMVNFDINNVVFSNSTPTVDLVPVMGWSTAPAAINMYNGNTATSSSVLPITANRSYAGMLLSDARTFVGANMLIRNCLFSNLNNGIVGLHTGELRVESSTFNAPTSFTTYFDGTTNISLPSACGIYFDGVLGTSNLIVFGGTGEVFSTIFNKWTRGIAFSRSDVKGPAADAGISHCKFNNCTTGIEGRACTKRTVNIDNNIINAVFRGIRLVQNQTGLAAGTQMYISGNEINNNAVTPVSPAFMGIEISETAATFNAGDIFKLVDNTVKLYTGSQNGMSFKNANQVKAASNTVFFYTAIAGAFATVPAGIKAEQCINANLNCNSVAALGGLPETNDYQAISLMACTQSKVSGNNTSMTRTGIWVNGGSSGLEIQGNVIGVHTQGLWYAAGATDAKQLGQGNMWLSNNAYASNAMNGIGAAVRYSAASNGSVVFQNRLEVGTTQTVPINLSALYGGLTYNPPSVYTDISGVTGWVLNSPSYSCVWPYCSGTWDCNIFAGRPANDPLSNGEVSAMNGLIPMTNYEDAQNWAIDKELYKFLLEKSNLSAAEQTFVDAKSTSSEGLLADLEKESAAVFEISNAQKQQIESYKLQLNNLGTQATLIDSLQHLPNADTATLNMAQRNILIQMAQINGLIENLLATIDIERNQEATALLIEQGTIPSIEVYESNDKTVQGIYLATIAKGITSFTSSQLTSLSEIAAQCPLAGGPGVIKARGLYALVADVQYNDESLCLASGYAWQEKSTLLNTGYSIVPNPNNGHFELRTPIMETTSQVSIYNTLGQLVFSTEQAAKSSLLSVSLEHLPQGIYYVQVSDNKNLLYSNKILVHTF